MELFLGLLVLVISFYSYFKVMISDERFNKPITLAASWVLLIGLNGISNYLLELLELQKTLFYVTLTVLMIFIIWQIIIDIKTQINKESEKDV